MNLIPPKIFYYLLDNVLKRNRDRLAMACFATVQYRGLGGDTMASLWAATVLERQQEVEDASLARDRTRYKDARDEHKRCQAFGIVGRGLHAVTKVCGIYPI